MDRAIRPVQWKACSRGHIYLGKECPCEQVNRRYRPKRIQQSSPEDSLQDAETAQQPE